MKTKAAKSRSAHPTLSATGTRRGNQNSHLERKGNIWQVVVRVPDALREVLGRAHFKRSLRTADLAIANTRKWEWIARFKHDIETARRKAMGLPADLREALEIRQQIAKAEPEDAELLQMSVLSVVEERHEAGKISEGKAHAYIEIATGTEPLLDDLIEEWIGSQSFEEVTARTYRTAYQCFRDFLCGKLRQPPLASHVTEETVERYLSDFLATSDLSKTTRLHRVRRLCTFWAWLAKKRKVSGNPWKDPDLSVLSRGAPEGPAKRPFTAPELLALMGGKPNETLRDAMVLSMYTGMRLEEICTLTLEDLTQGDSLAGIGPEVWFATVRKVNAKTASSARTVAICHPIPCSILARRMAGGSTELFPELPAGDKDEGRRAKGVSQSFRKYRRRHGVPDGTDFHSFRRTFITRMENVPNVDRLAAERYVGHKPKGMSYGLYSSGSTKATSAAFASLVSYPRDIEEAAQALFDRRVTGAQ